MIKERAPESATRTLGPSEQAAVRRRRAAESRARLETRLPGWKSWHETKPGPG